MLGLVPFVILCFAFAVVIIVWFARWQRRDKRAGDPWSADKAAKIYVGTVVVALIGALGLASTPLVTLDTTVVAGASSERATPAPTPPSDSPSPAPSLSTGPADDRDAEVTGRITLTQAHGVDLDTTDRVLLPTSGTPGLDVALDGSSYLHSPDGEVFARTTAEPGKATCGNMPDTDAYDDYTVGQSYCVITSEDATGYLTVVDVVNKASGIEVTVDYGIFDPVAVTSASEDSAPVIGDITVTEYHGVDLDTTDRMLLPTSGTPGLDLAIDGSGYLRTPDGTSLVRATSKPTRERCSAITDTDSYDDFAEGQWYCFTTSEGTFGYLTILKVTEKSSGIEVALRYNVFGEPRLMPGDDGEIDAGTTGEVALREYYGVDLDTTDRVPLPASGTPGLDLAIDGSGYLRTPDGTSLVRATSKPTRERCAEIAYRDSYDGFAEGQWYCFTTSEGVDGRMQVAEVTERSDSLEVTVAYALFR